MNNSKPVAKKQKATTAKKTTKSKSAAAKPLKLGGVPNQGKA